LRQGTYGEHQYATGLIGASPSSAKTARGWRIPGGMCSPAGRERIAAASPGAPRAAGGSVEGARRSPGPATARAGRAAIHHHDPSGADVAARGGDQSAGVPGVAGLSRARPGRDHRAAVSIRRPAALADRLVRPPAIDRPAVPSRSIAITA